MKNLSEVVFLATRKWRLVAVLLSAGILAGALAGVAFANSDTTQTATADSIYQSFIGKLAANLGVSQDQVSAAVDTTKKQMLDEAVQQGRITQEQADKMAVKKGLGFGCLGRDKDKNSMGYGMKGNGRNLELAAKALGISTEQIKTELQSGKNISDIVSGQGLTMDQFGQKMLELKKAEISQAVADGKITQEQADKMLQRMEKHLNNTASGTSN